MPVDVVGALVGWVVSLVGDAGIRFVRRSPDERALRKALGLALDRVVEQADLSCQEALRVGLWECFSTGPRVRLDASSSVGEGLRAAIAAQVAQLDQMVHGDSGQPFYQVVEVDREWLAEQVTVAIVTALRQVVAVGGLAELVHGVDTAEVLARLKELTVTAPAAAVRTLPRDIGSFTGRNGELRWLTQAVTGRAAMAGVVGIHAIDGMAGIGKTALAVHAAHQLTPLFPDGQIFLRLHAHTAGQQPVDPADALATLLLTIGVPPQQIPADGQARELAWRDRLSGKRVLLVLDDAAGPAQVSPLLPGTAESLVVITSRRRLALDEAVSISLDILTPEEAVVLFLRVASCPHLGPSDVGVTKVTRLCGYLPLAIRLVAGQLRRPSWTVAEIAAKLGATQDRLAAIDAGQRSVTAAFDLSYRDLTPDQRQLFRRLGLQPGVDIDAYAAAALGGTTVAAARRHLENLEDLHLLDEPVRGRYRLHDLLRDYARTLAATDPPAEREAALDRLLDYYLHTTTLAATHLSPQSPATGPAVAHPPDSAPELVTREAAIAWLEAERANLYAAVDYAVLHGRHHYAISLPAAMQEFLRAQGPWNQALTLHHTALEATRITNDRLGEANTLNEVGIVQRLTGDYPAATASLGQALALHRGLSNRLGEAKALNNLGIVQYSTGDYPAAGVNQQQALALYRHLGDQLGEANVLHDLGIVQRLIGDYPAATASQQQALALYRHLDDRRGQANALSDLGLLQYLTGDYPAATASQQQAMALCRGLGNRLGEAKALNYLAIVQYSTGDYPAAAASLRQALALSRDLGDRLGEASALHDLGIVQRLIGDYPAATASQQQAMVLYRHLGSQRGEANALHELGIMQRLIGDCPAATASQQQAMVLYRHLGSQRGEANALHELGIMQRLIGDCPAATASQQQAMVLYRHLGDRRGEANALSDVGLVQHLTGDYPAATASLEQALALHRSLGNRLGEAKVLNNLGQVLRASGAAADARVHHSRALGMAQDLGTPLEEAHALEGIGHCHLQQKQPSEGGACLRYALALYQRLGSPDTQRVATTLFNLNQGLLE
jgi:tetratricopeptide (TPR) repeat protein